MKRTLLILTPVVIAAVVCLAVAHAGERRVRVNVQPRPAASDPSVKLDYDIVYVRAPRHGDKRPTAWAEVFAPTHEEPGADLMLLHPDGTEELLVPGGDGGVADPYVSFDGQWVYFAKFEHLRKPAGARWQAAPPCSDIYKIHVKSRRLVRLTEQAWTPNINGEGPWLHGRGVFNLSPCPVPGRKIVFTSNRN
ncbi:MAG TPA: hypothetical protein VFA18_13345, partial [Gemmataceae bacterium]|nr:hypothetical protein [Gemmataceae bacterium]